MKSIVKWTAGFAAAAALATTQAWAQGAKPAAKPAPAKEAKAATKEAKASTTAHKSRRSEDARECLERPSNTEVIKCAEAYL